MFYVKNVPNWERILRLIAGVIALELRSTIHPHPLTQWVLRFRFESARFELGHFQHGSWCRGDGRSSCHDSI